jgi:ribA/ribD-fused uncharacterized protein
MAREITQFQGEWRFLSNFGPGQVLMGGITFPRREHAYQAYKESDPAARQWYADPGLTAGQAKRGGQKARLRPDWEQVKKRVMLQVVLAWAVQNPDLAAQLVATEDAYLEEGNNWHDNYWGACGCSRHIGDGLNYLGRILMMVRDIVRVD